MVEHQTPRPPSSQRRGVARGLLLIGNFVSSTRGTRGICEELAARLAFRNWTVFTASDKRTAFPRLLDIVTTAWRHRHRYQVAQVDVYSGRAFIWAEAVCVVMRLARKPYVLILRGGNLPVFARRWPWRVRALLRSAQVVAAPSTYLLQQMTPYRDDLRLLPNPLQLSDYNFRLRAQAAPRLVWLRAFYRTYNPTLAPRVLALLASDFPDVRLWMVGPDWNDGSLQATRDTAEQMGVMDRIVWAGSAPKTAVPDWLNQGDVFLNTTNIDNTPVSMLEAMACGLCVVSTNVGGIPYLVEAGRDALLVPPDDAAAMAAAVRRILTDPDLAARLSGGARASVEPYDWSVILPRWEQLLETVGECGRATLRGEADPLGVTAQEADQR
jgi:glycosyltransferase involved in cell wall biosynthesis